MTAPSPPGAAVEAMALYDRVVDLVVTTRRGSTSFVQRTLGLGYNAASRLIERMEREGILSSPNSAGVRVVLSAAPAAGDGETGA